jgi:4a-hydroxytetrahydrobiopterin dehydratase
MTEVNTGLASQQCSDLPAENSALNHDEAATLLKTLDPHWQIIDNRAISFSYNFKNYYLTMAFVNVIAQIAHQQNHHPDLLVSYNRCTVTYSTHSVGGLSINDFICAAKINAAQKL